MCSNVMVQHCPRPLAPAPAELCFQTDSKRAQWSQRTRKYNLHYDDVRGEVKLISAYDYFTHLYLVGRAA